MRVLGRVGEQTDFEKGLEEKFKKDLKEKVKKILRLLGLLK